MKTKNLNMKHLLVIFGLVFMVSKAHAQQFDYSKWELTWEDDFNYKNEVLDENWVSANQSSPNLYCSRWRENVDVKDGVMFLENRKENRGGQEWTSGSIWTKKKFKYGYFECRYKYAAAEATNNSFWLMTKGDDPTEGKRFEIDINEGHFPNSVNSNIHNWTDITENANGKKTHPSYAKSYYFGTNPDYSIQLELPVSTKKVRFVSKNLSKFHIGEFRVYGINESGEYPRVLSPTADTDIAGLVNYARSQNVKIHASGSLNDKSTELQLIDGDPNTPWSTQEKGDKWVEFEWSNAITIGCIQFVNGWKDQNENWRDLLPEYKVQYLSEKGLWKDISVLDVAQKVNFAEEYHVHGLDWNEKELIFYLDGKEIRREKNEFCHSEVPILLSLAIIKWSGTVTDAIDKTSMKVDYVKYYKRKK